MIPAKWMIYRYPHFRNLPFSGKQKPHVKRKKSCSESHLKWRNGKEATVHLNDHRSVFLPHTTSRNLGGFFLCFTPLQPWTLQQCQANLPPASQTKGWWYQPRSVRSPRRSSTRPENPKRFDQQFSVLKLLRIGSYWIGLRIIYPQTGGEKKNMGDNDDKAIGFGTTLFQTKWQCSSVLKVSPFFQRHPNHSNPKLLVKSQSFHYSH